VKQLLALKIKFEEEKADNIKDQVKTALFVSKSFTLLNLISCPD